MESRVDLLQCILPKADSSAVPGRCNFRVGGSTHRVRIALSSLEVAVVAFFGLSSSLAFPVQMVAGFAKVVAGSRNPFLGGVAGILSVIPEFVDMCVYLA